jgi:hypothetical protein
VRRPAFPIEIRSATAIIGRPVLAPGVAMQLTDLG